MQELNLKQMLKISHALGIDLFKSVISHKLKDKTLPKEFYRNRFQTEHDEIFEGLVTIGYAEKTKWQDLPFYCVTDDGEKQFMKKFSEMVIYKPKQLRDLSYLKHRINFYCSFYNYHFCDDNSKHIIDEYSNKYINGIYVSHTTKDCIQRFKTELKSYHKQGLLN